MSRLGDREWHERFERDRRQFERTWRWMFPLAVILAILGALVAFAVYAGAAAWLWSHVQ